MNKKTTNEFDTSNLDTIVKETGASRRGLIGILHAIQEKYRYLPRPQLDALVSRLQMTLSELVSVASFYPQFRFSPAGEHRLKVCVGTACHVKGAEMVFHGIRQYLGIGEGADTDADGLFTVEKVACLGCCMLAPAVQIDEVTYGYLSTEKIPVMIDDFLRREKYEGANGNKRRSVTGTNPAGEIRMCVCSSCDAAGAGAVYRELGERIRELWLPVRLTESGCSGLSFEAPLVELLKDGRSAWYGRVTPDMADGLLAGHFPPPGGLLKLREKYFNMLDRLLLPGGRRIGENLLEAEAGDEAPFTGKQVRIVTDGAHRISPLDLAAYRASGGFQALEQVKKTADKKTMIDIIEESGLRGRGGAGFPTHQKWRAVFDAPEGPRYIVCNGDEGDPGAFMDRMILESFPFRVIEGIAIAATVLDVSEAFLYIRTEYPLALSRLKQAILHCQAAGILGEDARGPGKAFRLTLVEGGGAFVAGEETALLASIEGRRSEPRLRPPYPSEKGLDGRPTLINNVETFAAVPWIIRHGPRAFNRLGTARSKGTKTFALAGKVKRGGLIEVPMGITLREIIFEIGGGIQNDRALKAVQIGGPSGGCLPASLIDLPVDFEALSANGAMMGSGGLVVLDETDCMVEIARYFMRFTQAESCGKCTVCRVGTLAMEEILEKLTKGQGTKEDLAELERLANTVKEMSLCGLGRTAPNPVLTTLAWFREEYLRHTEGTCDATMCAALVTYSITEKCIGCTRCSQICPAEAIRFTPYERHTIDSETCIRCGACRQVCPSGAVEVR